MQDELNRRSAHLGGVNEVQSLEDDRRDGYWEIHRGKYHDQVEQMNGGMAVGANRHHDGSLVEGLEGSRSCLPRRWSHYSLPTGNFGSWAMETAHLHGL